MRGGGRNKLDAVYEQLCSYDNLELAYTKARRGKTLKTYVIEFEEKLTQNLLQLRNELLLQTYQPRPLKTFILRDPKTRKISKSDFRDRIVHHAICNIIEPIFDKKFIYDSYANRFGKGTLKALQRFDVFKRKVSQNNTIRCFVLKADVRHYFDTVNHTILLNILQKTISDERLLWLIKVILANHHTEQPGKGMPLGNLTSQFFANVYLNELDQFVKHKLREKYYLRYVDDFVILHKSRKRLEEYKNAIDTFLQQNLNLTLHPDKSQILKLEKGIGFLGFRVFPHHKLIRKKNLRKFERRFEQMKVLYKQGSIEREKVVEKFEGWMAYSSHGNTYKYRRNITCTFNQCFPIKPQIEITHVKKHEKFNNKIDISNLQFSIQKTLHLFKDKKLNIPQIAQRRSIKEATVWEHLANLIEHHQIPLRYVLPPEKISKILPAIKDEHEKLKDIKNKITDATITYSEINCALASIKCKNKEKNITHLTKWYQRTNCYRKCYHNQKQRQECRTKFNHFTTQNPHLKLKTKEFIHLFNNHINICILPEQEKKKIITWKEFITKIKKK